MNETVKIRGNRYFRVMAFILICIAIGGFSLNGIVNRDHFPPLYPLLLLHIIVMVGWFVLFIIQTQLIGRGSYARHMLLGTWSIILAVGIVITGIFINRVTYNKGSDLVIVAGNFGALINFSLAYATGYFLRKNIEWHRRAMLLAGIAIVAPAIARFVIVLHWPMPAVFGIYLMLIISLSVFDYIKFKRVQRISIIGGITIFVMLLGAFIFGTTHVWADFITAIWG